MPRLENHTNRDAVPDALRDAFDAVAAERNGAVSGPYGVLLHSPEVALRGARLGNYVRFHSELSPVDREIAIITAAREFDARVQWAGHVRLGREAGVREEVIDAVGRRADLDALSEEEAQVVRYVRELLGTNRVSASTFESLHERLGDRGIVDLTGLVGYYAFVAYTLNAFEIEPAEGAPQLPEVDRLA